MSRQGSVTLRDVAARAGVALGTASHVLAEKQGVPVAAATREAVRVAARDLGYEPRRRRTARTARRIGSLGLVLRAESEAPWLTCGFYASVLFGAEQACAERGIGLMVATARQDAARVQDLPAMIARRQVQGLLVLGYFQPAFFTVLPAVPMPYVLLDHLPPVPCVDAVTADDEQGGYTATRMLLDRVPSHVPPAMIAGPLSHASIAGRLAGYRRALTEARIPHDEALIRYGNLRPTGGFAAMNALLDLAAPPTAVFCCNDDTAQGALAALRARGLAVPAACSVIGFDDLDLAAHTAPPLTTIRVEKEALGRQGIWHLLERLAFPDLPPRSTRLAIRLIERESVRAAHTVR